MGELKVKNDNNTDQLDGTRFQRNQQGKRLFFRFLKWGVIGLVMFLIVATVAFYQIENRAAAREWEEMKAQLEESGVSFDPQDYEVDMPPDKENFAMSPVILALTRNSEIAVPTLSQEEGEAVEFFRSVNLPGSRYHRHKSGDFGYGLPPNFSFWPVSFEEGDDLYEWNLPEGHDVWTPAAVDKVFGSFDQSITVFLREAKGRPFTQYPVEIPPDYEERLERDLCSLENDMQAVLFLSTRMLFAIRAGDRLKARDAGEVAIRVAELRSDRSSGINLIVSTATYLSFLQAFWYGFEREIWTGDDLRFFESRLEHVSLVKGLSEFLKYSLVMDFFASADLCMVSRKKFHELTGATWSIREPTRWDMLVPYLPDGFWLRNKTEGGRYILDHFLKPAETPETVKDMLFDSEGEISKLNSQRSFWLKNFFGYEGAMTRRAVDVQSKINLAIAACAVERFRLENNRIPASLEELAAANSGEIRDDLFNPGSPLQYRKDPGNGRYVLYSYGPNGRDDGGISKSRTTLDPFGTVNSKNSDIAWRYSTPEILKIKADFEEATARESRDGI